MPSTAQDGEILFTVPLNAFMTIWCSEARSMWWIKDLYSLPTLALRG